VWVAAPDQIAVVSAGDSGDPGSDNIRAKLQALTGSSSTASDQV
jgi:hypothetical protein